MSEHLRQNQNPEQPPQEEASDVAFRGLSLAIAHFRLSRADKLIDKLEIKEEVSSMSAGQALSPPGFYDDRPEHEPYRPVGPLERFLATRRKEAARKTRLKEYEQRKLVEIHGESISRDIPHREERLQNSERVTMREHRQKVVAANSRHRHGVEVAGHTVGGTDKQKERLQKIVARDTKSAKLRQWRIENAKERALRMQQQIDSLEHTERSPADMEAEVTRRQEELLAQNAHLEEQTRQLEERLRENPENE